MEISPVNIFPFLCISLALLKKKEMNRREMKAEFVRILPHVQSFFSHLFLSIQALNQSEIY